MALGDANANSGGNNKNRVFDPTYYSRIRIKNKDKLALGFSFCKGLLKVELLAEKEGYRFEPLTEINISATKAKMLINQFEAFIKRMQSGEHIDPNEAVGVNCGFKETTTFIALKVTGNRSDVPEHSLSIGKINSNGQVSDVYEFVFNVDYDFSLQWNNIEKMEFEKSIDQFMGINTFVDVLREFAYTSSGATGAAVWDTGRYEVNRINRNFYSIFEKLGIERTKATANVGDNFFNRGNGNAGSDYGRSQKRSYEDIEDMLS